MHLDSRQITPQPERFRRSLLSREIASKIFLILVLLVAIALSLSQFLPQAIVPATGPVTEFSAERAIAFLRMELVYTLPCTKGRL